MAGRYERVSSHDADSFPSATQPPSSNNRSIPHSPPPSFHSLASSIRSREHDNRVDPNLADAFDAADDDSDEEEPDDRQRLVRGNSFPIAQPQQPTRQQLQNGDASMAQRQAQAQAQASAAGRVYGSGIQADGVFSNLSAKPERTEGEKEEQPPTYEQAAADAVPPYWETTILAPGLGGAFDEVYIDGMPVGSFFSFVWNGMISMSFQLVGFLLTYLLHSTHAAKNGSRAGLGITLIQYGFYMKGSSSSGSGSGAGGMATSADGYAQPPDPNAHDFDPSSVGQENGSAGGGGIRDIASSEWAAYMLMIVGWFILIRAVSDYVKARRHEQLVRQSPDRGLGLPIIAEGEAMEAVV